MTDNRDAVEPLTLDEVHAFLLGTGPVRGVWFGEAGSGQPYWWRKFLREALSHTTPAPDEEVENRIAKAIQVMRDETGATEQQRIALAYAEAAIRAEFAAMRGAK